MDPKTIATFLTCSFLITNVIVSVNADDQSKLRLVSVVFRHGDRAPDPVEMFPKDPHYNDSFWPEGLGGLTNNGKARLYELGKLLRNKYDEFLGDIWLPESVFARSTDYKRTKMSLQLVLASLYPPRGIQIWNKELLWQPIPMTYVASKRDWLMIPEECPEYLKERARVESLDEVQNKIESFRSFMNNLTILTGKNISKPIDMYNLYHILTAESFQNLTLPNWTKDIFPYGELFDGINLEYEIFSYTELMRRLNGGKLLYKIIKDMNAVITGTMDEDRRISLYSGHETNVAALLQTLGVYEPHVPAYTSAVIVELHELNGEYFIKVIYYLGVPSKFEEKQISDCDVLCPFDKFVNLLENVTPSKEELNCDRSKNFNEIEPNYNVIQQ